MQAESTVEIFSFGGLVVRFLLFIILFAPLCVQAQTGSCAKRPQKTVEERQSCLSALSMKYQAAEAKGDLKLAYKVITEEIEPLLGHKDSSALRTEELLMNLSRIKESLNSRMNKNKK